MPHNNVLDLAVFPAMSRRHCSEARRLHSVRVLREDDIWTTAVNVWKELPLGKIANSFVLARRIAQKIIFQRDKTNSWQTKMEQLLLGYAETSFKLKMGMRGKMESL